MKGNTSTTFYVMRRISLRSSFILGKACCKLPTVAIVKCFSQSLPGPKSPESVMDAITSFLKSSWLAVTVIGPYGKQYYSKFSGLVSLKKSDIFRGSSVTDPLLKLTGRGRGMSSSASTAFEQSTKASTKKV